MSERACMRVIKPCDRPAKKAVQMLNPGAGEWLTVLRCDEQGKEHITFDKDSVSIRPIYSLIEAMREKRQDDAMGLSEPAQALAAIVGNICPEDEAL